MSTSFRCYSIPKTESAELQKCKTTADLLKYFKEHGLAVYADDDFCYLPDAATPVYDFGDADFYEGVWKLGKPLFDEDCELNDTMSDFCPYIAGADAFRYIMRWYTERVRNCLTDLLRDVSENEFHKNESQLDRLVADARERLVRWYGEFGPMSKSGGDDIVTHSWCYEYAYFNLVSIFKHFDFENNDMLFMY